MKETKGLKTIGIKPDDHERIKKYGQMGEPMHMVVTRILDIAEGKKVL
jgi:hypothetical protein